MEGGHNPACYLVACIINTLKVSVCRLALDLFGKRVQTQEVFLAEILISVLSWGPDAAVALNPTK